MNKNISNIKTVSEYNDLLGVETLHPLVSVIDLSKVDPINNMRLIFDFYVVFLKEDKNCDLLYGRQRYDYQKGSIVSLAPGQVIGNRRYGGEVPAEGLGLVLSSRPDSRHDTGTQYQRIHILFLRSERSIAPFGKRTYHHYRLS